MPKVVQRLSERPVTHQRWYRYFLDVEPGAMGMAEDIIGEDVRISGQGAAGGGCLFALSIVVGA